MTGINTLKPFDVCVMSDVSIQATLRIHAANAEEAGEEAINLASAGTGEFDICTYDRSYYLPGGVEEAVSEAEEDTQEVDRLGQFLFLLDSSHAISVDDHAPTRDIHRAEITDEPDNEILLIEWEHEGVGHSIKLTPAGIGKGKIDNGAFVCEDHDGDEVRIKFFALTQHYLS